jgi:hypothetical protein
MTSHSFPTRRSSDLSRRDRLQEISAAILRSISLLGHNYALSFRNCQPRHIQVLRAVAKAPHFHSIAHLP